MPARIAWRVLVVSQAARQPESATRREAVRTSRRDLHNASSPQCFEPSRRVGASVPTQPTGGQAFSYLEEMARSGYVPDAATLARLGRGLLGD